MERVDQPRSEAGGSAIAAAALLARFEAQLPAAHPKTAKRRPVTKHAVSTICLLRMWGAIPCGKPALTKSWLWQSGHVPYGFASTTSHPKSTSCALSGRPLHLNSSRAIGHSTANTLGPAACRLAPRTAMPPLRKISTNNTRMQAG